MSLPVKYRQALQGYWISYTEAPSRKEGRASDRYPSVAVVRKDFHACHACFETFWGVVCKWRIIDQWRGRARGKNAG